MERQRRGFFSGRRRRKEVGTRRFLRHRSFHGKEKGPQAPESVLACLFQLQEIPLVLRVQPCFRLYEFERMGTLQRFQILCMVFFQDVNFARMALFNDLERVVGGDDVD